MFQKPQIHSFKLLFHVSKIKINAHTSLGIIVQMLQKKTCVRNREKQRTEIHFVCHTSCM